MYEIQAYAYCPRCGDLFSKKHKTMLECGSCGLHYYIGPKACNAVIITNEKGEILLVRRKIDPQKNMWDLPGGFIEPGETVEESIQREIREELSVEVKPVRYVGSYHDEYLYRGVTYQTLGVCYVCTIVGGTVTVQDDVSEAKFFAPDQIPFNEIAFKSVEDAINDYLAVVK